VAFIKGLCVMHVFKADTGKMVQRHLPLTTIATGQDIPTSHGWKIVNNARGDKSHQRPRKRH
jgi:hypothetical protein